MIVKLERAMEGIGIDEDAKAAKDNCRACRNYSFIHYTP